MFSLRTSQRAQSFSAALFASIVMLAVMLPARADETAAASRSAAQARRAPASFAAAATSPLGGVPASRQATGYSQGFLFPAGPQPLLNVGGRVPVGKSHIYVPYYGDVTGDPAHPSWQGAAGLAYGFRTWDISVVNGGFGAVQNPVPGTEQPKANPSLSLSIRF